MARICDHADERRCHRHVRFVEGYKVFFGHRIGPHGEEPVYQEQIRYRCPVHLSPPSESLLGRMTIGEYERRVALLSAGKRSETI